jgi:hypothetical protein
LPKNLFQAGDQRGTFGIRQFVEIVLSPENRRQLRRRRQAQEGPFRLAAFE